MQKVQQNTLFDSSEPKKSLTGKEEKVSKGHKIKDSERFSNDHLYAISSYEPIRTQRNKFILLNRVVQLKRGFWRGELVMYLRVRERSESFRFSHEAGHPPMPLPPGHPPHLMAQTQEPSLTLFLAVLLIQSLAEHSLLSPNLCAPPHPDRHHPLLGAPRMDGQQPPRRLCWPPPATCRPFCTWQTGTFFFLFSFFSF